MNKVAILEDVPYLVAVIAGFSFRLNHLHDEVEHGPLGELNGSNRLASFLRPETITLIFNSMTMPSGPSVTRGNI